MIKRNSHDEDVSFTIRGMVCTDPELERQANDSISFHKFLGFS